MTTVCFSLSQMLSKTMSSSKAKRGTCRRMKKYNEMRKGWIEEGREAEGKICYERGCYLMLSENLFHVEPRQDKWSR